MRWFAPVVAAAVVGAGCGRIDFRNAPADAAVHDAPVLDASIPAVDASLIDPCAATYTTMHGQSHYRFSGTPAAWDIAEHACEADGRGSHLAVFNDSLEMNLIEADVNPTVFWVGVTDRVHDGTFIDVMGEQPLPFLPGWTPGDPSFSGPGCVEHNPSTRLFHDLDCSTEVAYVCECDGIPAQPSAY